MLPLRSQAKSRRGAAGRWLCALAVLLLPCSPAHAVDINGAWVTNADACKSVFARKGNQMRLAPDADIHGSGFVIDGNIIRGKLATCKITSLKEEGATVHVRAACVTDIMQSNNEFALTLLEGDKLLRAYPGIPELDTLYFRCR